MENILKNVCLYGTYIQDGREVKELENKQI
jgi:hypothetical protein